MIDIIEIQCISKGANISSTVKALVVICQNNGALPITGLPVTEIGNKEKEARTEASETQCKMIMKLAQVHIVYLIFIGILLADLHIDST